MNKWFTVRESRLAYNFEMVGCPNIQSVAIHISLNQ